MAPRLSTPPPCSYQSCLSPPPAPRRRGNHVDKHSRHFSIPRMGHFAAPNRNISQPAFNWEGSMNVDEEDDYGMGRGMEYQGGDKDSEMHEGVFMGDSEEEIMSFGGTQHLQQQVNPVTWPARPSSAPLGVSCQQRLVGSTSASTKDFDMFMGEDNAVRLPVPTDPFLSRVHSSLASNPVTMPTSPGFAHAQSPAVHLWQHQGYQLQPITPSHAHTFGAHSLYTSPITTTGNTGPVFSSSPSFGSSSTIYSSTGLVNSSPIPPSSGVKRAHDLVDGEGEETEHMTRVKKTRMRSQDHKNF